MVLRVVFALKKHFSTFNIKILKEMDTPEKLREFYMQDLSVKDFINTIRQGFFLYKNDPEYPWPSIIPSIKPKFTSIINQIENLELKDLSALVYIYKSSKESKFSYFYPPEYQNILLNRIEKALTSEVDFDTLTHLFRDLSLIDHSPKKLETFIFNFLNNPSKAITMEGIRRILIGVTYKNREKNNHIEEKTLERLRTFNLSTGTNKEISDCLRLLAFISKKKDISDILAMFLSSVHLRICFFSFSEIRPLLEYCLISEVIDKGLLYDALYHLEQLLIETKDILGKELSATIQVLKELYKKDPNLRIRPQLKEKLTETTLNLFMKRKIQLLRTFECLSDIDDICEVIPESIHQFLMKFRNNHTVGYWKLIYLKLLSKKSSIVSFTFPELSAVHTNLLNSSVSVKVKSLIKLNQIKDFSLNPYLKEIHEMIIESLFNENFQMINVIHFTFEFENLKNILSKEDTERLVKKVLNMLEKNVKKSDCYFIVKYSLIFQVRSKEIFNIWTNLIKKLDISILDTIVSFLITDFRPTSNLAPYLFLISTLKSRKDHCLAKLFSISSEKFEFREIMTAFNYIKQEEPEFLLSFHFTYSKNCLISKIFQTVSPAELASFSNKMIEIVDSIRFDLKVMKNLIKLIAFNSLLTSKITEKIIKSINNFQNSEIFEEYVSEYSEILSDSDFANFQTFLRVKPEISNEKLLKILKFYLKKQTELPFEESFIELCIKRTRNQGSSYLRDLIRILSESKNHDSLRLKMLLEINDLFIEKIETFSLYELMEIFNNLLLSGIHNDQILLPYEKRIFTQTLDTFAGIRLLKNYLKAKRFNHFFSLLCNKINSEFASIYSLELSSFQKNQDLIQDLPEDFKSFLLKVDLISKIK
jgi:hypothetical protein